MSLEAVGPYKYNLSETTVIGLRDLAIYQSTTEQ